jgi:hypothetical protein
MKNCRPNSLWIRIIDKVFGIRFTCDHRCEMGNPEAPCQYPKPKRFTGCGGCRGNCNQGRLPCDCK